MGSIHGLEKHNAERTAVYRKVTMEKDIVQNYDELYALQDFAVDNVFNILANKLTAVIGRDEEKDVFDIVSVCLMYEFDWKMILKAAHQKEYFDDCTLIERLKTFPLWWLENLKLIKPMPITETLISTLCQDISHKDKNSVFGIKYE